MLTCASEHTIYACVINMATFTKQTSLDAKWTCTRRRCNATKSVTLHLLLGNYRDWRWFHASQHWPVAYKLEDLKAVLSLSTSRHFVLVEHWRVAMHTLGRKGSPAMLKGFGACSCACLLHGITLHAPCPYHHNNHKFQHLLAPNCVFLADIAILPQCCQCMLALLKMLQ